MFSGLLNVALLFMMHPVHETVSEVQWNPESKCLEVSLRLSVLDEQWIHREMSKDSKKEDAKIGYLRYLKSRFLLDPAGKKKPADHARYKWIGRSEEGSHVWWYFEVYPDDKLRPKKLENRLMFDRDKSYTNRVLILETEKPKRAITLSTKHPEAALFSNP